MTDRAETTDLHARLIAQQSSAELARKALKAAQRARLWTREEIDAAERRAQEIRERLQWD